VPHNDILNCATGEWTIKYLGVPVTNSKLHVVDWLPLDEKLIKRMDGWKGSALSFGVRLILINQKKIFLARGRRKKKIPPCQMV
jgi:hypothetical protein